MTRILFLTCLLAFVSSSLLAQTPVVFAKKRTTTITINGNPNEAEWTFANTVAKTILGSPNNTVSYAVLWDSLYLYVAAKVTDANKFNESTNGWDDDAIEIFIDAENNGGTSYGVNDRQFVKEWNSSAIWEKGSKTTGVTHGWANITGGYAIEMRIPWSNVGITNPALGSTIGFDVANDDDDNGSVRESQLQWSGDGNNWQYTQNFGDLVLSLTGNDALAPTAPTNLSASALTQSSLTLNWTASTDNIGVTGYDVYRNGTKINSSLVTATTYNVTGLTAATAYQFYIQAKDAAGNISANSNVLNTTTPDTQAPTAPSALTSSSLTATSVTLNWAPSTDNVGVTGYDVYRNGIKINTSLVTTTTYNVAGLTGATTYQFYIQAKDAAGNISASSNTINITTADNLPPTAPANLVASAITQSSLTLSWNASTDNAGVSGYDIYRNGTKINASLVAATTYNVSGLAAATVYQFYVIAKDAAGNVSANSNTLNITTPDTQVPTAPSALTSSSLTATSVTLNWTVSTDNVGVSGYDVYRNGIKINTSLVTTTTYNVAGLTGATTYQFYIQAKDAAGNISVSSNTINITTADNLPPTAPADLVASAITQSSLTLSWTASTDNAGVSGYDIYRNGTKMNASLVTAATYNVGGLAAATVYQFYVVAKDAAGNVSANSNTLNITTPDTQAPTAPANPAIAALTQTSFTLNWNASTDNVGVAGYDVYQDGAKINGSLVTATTYNVTGLSASTAYQYYVQAKDAAGNATNSSILNVTTPAPPDTEAPSAPANLATSNIAQSSVDLSWSAATDNIGVTGYDVYKDNNKIGSTSAATITYHVTGLSALVNYNFYVVAKDAAGNFSTGSNPVSIITPDTEAPVAPASLNTSVVTQTTLTLTWSAGTDNVGVAGYDIYQDNNKINSTPLTVNSFDVSGLNSSTTYSFYVQAADAAGNVSNSASVNVTTQAPPDVENPSAIADLASANLTQSSVILSWTGATDNVGVTGYDIYQNNVLVATAPGAAASYTVTGLVVLNSYDFYIVSKDAAGNSSANSNTVSVTTPDTEAPTAPSGMNYSNLTATSVTISWTASTDNVGVTGYDVFQDNVKINTVPVTGTSYSVTGLTQASTYSYFVKAIDGAGNASANSNNINISTPDISAPTAPANLASSALTMTALTLNWSAASDNVGVSGYDVYRNGVKINAAVVTGTSYNVTGLNAATAYSFYIQARDAAGNISANSNTINITTPDTQAPTAPASLASSNLAANSVMLNWVASTDNVGITGYDVYQDNVKINIVPVTGTTYDVTGLAQASAYNFYVKALDNAGNASANSNTVSINTPDVSAPTAPANLVSSALTMTTATLSWSAASDNVGVSGYDVYRNGVKINAAVVTGTSYNVTGLNAATAYSFYIQARDAAGNISANSNTINISTPDTQAPTAPANLASSNLTANSVSLNWAASTDNIGVTGYDVYQDNVKINTVPVTGTTYTITGLAQATAYSFYVKALDNAGNTSANSSTVSINTPDVSAPTAPANLVSSALTSATLTLNWSVSTDNVGVAGYDVYRNGVKINGAVVTAATFNVTGLTASTAYSFYVQARDAAGNISGNSNTLNITTPAASACASTGTIAYQKWNSITGTTVASLTSNAAYPNSPSATGTLTSFEIPSAAGDNYGMRVNGYICPPTTGSYTFWIAGDDNVELWLSTTSSSTNKVRIAYHTSYTNSREWNKFTTQKSAAITLTAGQAYYVEALVKEGTGGDNMAVGWAKPGQATTTPGEVIPGTQLLAQLADTQAPTAATNVTASAITQTTLTLTWTASTDNVAVSGYDVYKNNVKVNGSNITTNSYNVTGLTPATLYSFYVVAKDAAGNTSTSSTINATTGAPDTQAPSAPTNLAAGNMGQTFFTLSWSAATDNVGVTGYDIYKNGVKDNTSLVPSTSYAVTGLTPGTTYALTVIAKDAAGNSSAVSTVLNVTTLLPTAGSETFTQRTVIGNQRMPHDLVYGPDNNIWYTERFAGTVSFVNPATSVKKVVLSLGANMVRTGGQDGLMGLALHPQFNTGKPYVYISYTYQSTSTTVRKTRIERYTYNSTTQTLGSPVTILQDIPGSNDHNSSRLAIGPDLKLYYTVGDMGAGQFDNAARANNAQNLNVQEGKVLRLNTELISSSWIPTDNPFSNAGVKTAVYTFGHRNPQGLVWGNVNGANILYSSEHGPYSDDELNVIEVGRNYGWPQVAGFCDGNYNGRTIGGFAVISEQNNCTTLNAKEPIRSLFPVATPPTDATGNMTWPSTAPSGTDFYGSTAIPGWKNSLLVAQLKSGTITRFKLSNDGLSIISDTIHYFRGKGRFRDVVVSQDGLKIYVACDSSGSTSGPTGGVTSTPANPGSILEFTYQAPIGLRTSSPPIVATIAEVKQDNSIDVYPNPANDFIIVYSYATETGRGIELHDVTGKIVRKQTATKLSTRIETSNLASGLYILKVRDAKGKVIRLEKILIQH